MDNPDNDRRCLHDCPSTSPLAACRQIGCRSVVIPINCDAMLLHPAKQGRTRRSDERERERERATLPCGCALPHIADAAFESLGGVPEGADATVPVAVISGLFGLSFWPYKLDKMLRSS